MYLLTSFFGERLLCETESITKKKSQGWYSLTLELEVPENFKSTLTLLGLF